MMVRRSTIARQLLAGAILSLILLAGCQPVDEAVDVVPGPTDMEGGEPPEQGPAEKEVPLWDESMTGDRLTLPEDLSDYSWRDPTSFFPREIIGVVDLALLFENHNLQKKLDNLIE